MTRKVIDIRSNIRSYGLFARMIWAHLSKYFLKQVGKENLDAGDWDSFLCDLKYIEQYLIEGHSKLYWYCCGSYTDVTYIQKCDLDTEFEIELTQEAIIITQLKD